MINHEISDFLVLIKKGRIKCQRKLKGGRKGRACEEEETVQVPRSLPFLLHDNQIIPKFSAA